MERPAVAGRIGGISTNVNSSIDILILKVLIAPAFVGLVSLIALRYGHRVAGWLVALPITTGTVLLVLTLTEGTTFASSAALGALLGVVSTCVFALGYARAAPRYPWAVCLGVAATGFAVSTLLLSRVPEQVLVDLIGTVFALCIVLVVLPMPGGFAKVTSLPRWEIPVRMLTAAVIVLTITTAAANLGSQLSGLLSPIPVFTITLVIFTHSREGPSPVFVFLRGLLYGLFSFAAFCAVVAVLLVPYGVGIAFTAGLGALLGVYGVVRLVLRRIPER
ncbi:MAG: hypothetical protein WB873_01505 [Thermoplasmata archaeon]